MGWDGCRVPQTGSLKRGDGLWGEGKWVRGKIKDVGGESRLRTGPQRKE